VTVEGGRRDRSLGGLWRFRRDPKDLGEHYADQLNTTHAHDARWSAAEYDDSRWETIRVPAHWQDEGHAYNGVAWYRMTFEAADVEHGQRSLLEFDGVDYYADIWLNGVCLGSHEGYFGRFGFDVTDVLSSDRPNTLAVRADAPQDTAARGEEHEIGQLKTVFKGSLGRCDTTDPSLSPGGIWADVRLINTGPVRIDGLTVRAEPRSLPPIGAPDQPVEAWVSTEVRLSRAVSSTDLAPVELTCEVVPVDGDFMRATVSRTVQLGAGVRTVDMELQVPAAGLWWTWDLGTPRLYRLVVTVQTPTGPSDRLERRFGIRRIEREDGWATHLNGVRVFQRGANYQSDQLLSRMTDTRYAADIRLLRDANLNTVHPFCLVERDAFYDQCDAAGLLVYQDFPLWLMASTSSDFVRRALVQAAEMRERLGHHPCVAVWNLGSQPSIANFEKLCSALTTAARLADPGRIVHQANAAVTRAPDTYLHSTRSFFWAPAEAERLEASGTWRRDTHQYQGWYEGQMEDVRDIPVEDLQLVTEFGAQGMPRRETLAGWIDAEGLIAPDWPQFAARCMQVDRMLEFVPYAGDLDHFIADSQAYQAQVVRYHVEFYRRRKFRPCNGAHVFTFVDCWPSITWALVEYDRTPKPAYFALRRSMAPVQAFIDFDRIADGAGWLARLPITVVNDTSSTWTAARLSCRITPPTATLSQTAVETSTVFTLARFDTVDLELAPPGELPGSDAGSYQVELAVMAAEIQLSSNQYTMNGH
jgi:beta-mannosidase